MEPKRMDSQLLTGLSRPARRTHRLLSGLDCAVIRRSIRSWEWIPIACRQNGASRVFQSVSATVDFSHRAIATPLAAHQSDPSRKLERSPARRRKSARESVDEIAGCY